MGFCNSSKVNTSGSVEIFDARPILNARVNKVKGGGYEDCGSNSNYQNCKLTFLDIGNIHDVRSSYEKLYDVAYTPMPANERWTSTYNHNQLENTYNREVLEKILQGTNEILSSIENQQSTVVIHCSDGWDRTSQLSSLTQLLLDPYFRTFKGFQVLIEKDWCSFGHMFAKRCGHYSSGSLSDRC